MSNENWCTIENGVDNIIQKPKEDIIIKKKMVDALYAVNVSGFSTAFYVNGRQIILPSDKNPHEIPMNSPRLDGVKYKIFKKGIQSDIGELKIPNELGFDRYACQIKDHKFVLCSDSGGIDSYRTWETLYIGSFPIVERHVFTERFAKELPILIVDDVENITEEYLNDKYEEFSNREWNWDLLKSTYWNQLINKLI